MPQIEDFRKLDIRVGKIIKVDYFPEAEEPSYKLKVDLGGEFGIKNSIAQLTHYPINKLLWKQVVCIVNLPPKPIANAVSEVMVLGVSASWTPSLWTLM